MNACHIKKLNIINSFCILVVLYILFKSKILSKKITICLLGGVILYVLLSRQSYLFEGFQTYDCGGGGGGGVSGGGGGGGVSGGGGGGGDLTFSGNMEDVTVTYVGCNDSSCSLTGDCSQFSQNVAGGPPLTINYGVDGNAGGTTWAVGEEAGGLNDLLNGVQVNVLRKGVGKSRCDNVCGHVNVVGNKIVPVEGSTLSAGDCGISDGFMSATWTPILTKTGDNSFELSVNESAIQSDGTCVCKDVDYPPCTSGIETC